MCAWRSRRASVKNVNRAGQFRNCPAGPHSPGCRADAVRHQYDSITTIDDREHEFAAHPYDFAGLFTSLAHLKAPVANQKKE
jgi:hypothetical protein